MTMEEKEEEHVPEMLTHRGIAAETFNRCWQYIERHPDLTEDEQEEMLRLAEVSLWHWCNVPTMTDQNRAIGYWQLARVYTLAGEFEKANSYADKGIHIAESAELLPFYVAYAYEAKSRLLISRGEKEQGAVFLEKAWTKLYEIEELESRHALEVDLKEISSMISETV